MNHANYFADNIDKNARNMVMNTIQREGAGCCLSFILSLKIFDQKLSKLVWDPIWVWCILRIFVESCPTYSLASIIPTLTNRFSDPERLKLWPYWWRECQLLGTLRKHGAIPLFVATDKLHLLIIIVFLSKNMVMSYLSYHIQHEFGAFWRCSSNYAPHNSTLVLNDVMAMDSVKWKGFRNDQC